MSRGLRDERKYIENPMEKEEFEVHGAGGQREGIR